VRDLEASDADGEAIAAAVQEEMREEHEFLRQSAALFSPLSLPTQYLKDTIEQSIQITSQLPKTVLDCCNFRAITWLRQTVGEMDGDIRTSRPNPRDR
jgi:hypothetical protein